MRHRRQEANASGIWACVPRPKIGSSVRPRRIPPSGLVQPRGFPPVFSEFRAPSVLSATYPNPILGSGKARRRTSSILPIHLSTAECGPEQSNRNSQSGSSANSGCRLKCLCFMA
jgi:hypothetical protein